MAAIAGSLLIGALKQIGAGDIAKKALASGGSAIFNGIANRYGLDTSSPTFDKEAADAMLADKVEANRLMVELRKLDLEVLKTEVHDRQHARTVTMSAREKMSIEHQQRVDIINLYEAIAMSIGGLLLIMGLLGWLVFLHVFHAKQAEMIPEWLYMLMGTTITFISKDLVSLRAQYKHGSTEGSSKKNSIISGALKREQEDDEEEQPRMVRQVSTARPKHAPADAQTTVIDTTDSVDIPDIEMPKVELIDTTRPKNDEDEDNLL